MAQITFEREEDRALVSDYTMARLGEILDAAGCPRAKITSVCRTPQKLASIMYENCAAPLDKATGMTGLQSQRKLYFAPGQAVMDVFESMTTPQADGSRVPKQGFTRDLIEAKMAEKILAVGPTKVSHHCADPKERNVVDLAPSTIQNLTRFRAAVAAAMRPGGPVDYFLQPPNDKAFHLEFPQPVAVV